MAQSRETAVTEEEELQLELQLLRTVAGVKSAQAYPVGRIDPVRNNNVIRVVVERAARPIKVHLGEQLPSKLLAAREASAASEPLLTRVFSAHLKYVQSGMSSGGP